MSNIKGRVHSFQSLGTVDGPGVRFVVFMQGCNLRCACCHNPDTWVYDGGESISAEDIIKKVIRCRDYFGNEGGVTVSGGEPLCQADFVRELFVLCHREGINTCLDTSGSIINQSVESLLDVTDRVLLDIKFTDNEMYKEYVGCSFDQVIEFLDLLSSKNIAVTLRQVIIPTLNDTDDNILKLKTVAQKYSCIDKIELLPFKKICQTKYDSMGIKFRCKDIDEASNETMDRLNKILNG